MSAQHYIKVILPLRLEWEPCYITDADLRAGDRVAVIFAGRRVIGVVSDPDATPDIDPSRIRPILSIETGLDSISAEEISLWRFMADYYLCTTGEVYKAAYPVLKTASEETKVRVSRRKAMLEDRTIALWQQRIARLKARLDAKDAALSKNHGEAVRGRLEEQRRAIAKELQDAEGRLASFSARLAIAEGDYSSLLQNLPQQPLSPLLLQALASGKPILFKSAAREEAYLQACAMQLRKNRNACILVNEIELAGRLRDKLEGAFGELLLVHHSHMTRGAQRRIMDDIRSGRPYVLIGTRSSIFLPHHDLGLIIVDNEESPFYKQSDSAPRYNARDCAVQLARIHNCHIILGSCSPSLESALNVRTGKYFLLDLSSQGRELHPGCRYTLVDIRAEKKKNGMQGPVSRILAAAMARSGKCALIRGYEKPEELEGLQAHAQRGCTLRRRELPFRRTRLPVPGKAALHLPGRHSTKRTGRSPGIQHEFVGRPDGRAQGIRPSALFQTDRSEGERHRGGSLSFRSPCSFRFPGDANAGNGAGDSPPRQAFHRQ